MNQILNDLKIKKSVNDIEVTSPAISQYHQTTLGGRHVMRIGVYSRVSTEFESQKTSLDNQIDLFQKYAKDKGWEIFKVYTDSKSGTKSNRPGLKQLISDAKNKKFDVIMTKELSRLARNGKLSYELRDICQLNNIHIICLDGSIDSTEDNTENFGLYAWLYEKESQNSSRRNKQARQVKAERGEFIGSNAPYGYEKVNGKFVIRNDDTPNIVRRIFQEYLSGKGMDSIAKDLSIERIPTPSQIIKRKNAGIVWHSSTIKGMLHNPHYCGDLVQGRQEILSITSLKRQNKSKEDLIIHRDTHEPIISKEVFQTVQQRLLSRKKAPPKVQKHVFTNMVFCDDCKRGLWFKKNQRGYRCGGNIKHGDVFCKNRYVLIENDLEQTILNDLRNLFQSLGNERYLNKLSSSLNTRKNKIQHDLNRLREEITTTRRQKLKYVDLYTEEIITKDELNEYLNLSDEKVKFLIQQKKEFEEEFNSFDDKEYLLSLRNKLQNVLNLKNLTPELLNSLVDKITSTSEGIVNIHYRFTNPLHQKE